MAGWRITRSLRRLRVISEGRWERRRRHPRSTPWGNRKCPEDTLHPCLIDFLLDARDVRAVHPRVCLIPRVGRVSELVQGVDVLPGVGHPRGVRVRLVERQEGI